MTANESLPLGLALAAGLVLGSLFFAGLWWTVVKALKSKQPALWIFGSLMLRMAGAISGFYLISSGHWERLVLCLIGFLMARFIVQKKESRYALKSR